MRRSQFVSIALASLLLWHAPCRGYEVPDAEDLMLNAFTGGVVVDLREPIIEGKTLSTDQGGVLYTDDIRIQAQKIRFTSGSDDGKDLSFMVAEGCVMLEHCGRTFIADRVEYDFINQQGTLWNARTGIAKWFVGGEIFELNCDGSFGVTDAFLTTCENKDSEWQIRSSFVDVFPSGIIHARGTQFRFIRLPIFWVPSFGTNLDRIVQAPLKYDFRWGGQQGPRISVRYQALQSEHWSAWARLDWRLKRGLAGGLETIYEDDDNCESLTTLSYLARDNSAVNEHMDHRYLLKGRYSRILHDGQTTVKCRYTKASDEDVETDYYDRDFEVHNAGRSDLTVHSQSDWWSVYFLTRPRLNTFQNVKEELPSIDVSSHPIQICDTAWINDSRMRVGYYNFRYAKTIPNVNDYHSLRLEGRSRIYRNINVGCLSVTPEAEAILIGYSNSPGEVSDQGLWLGIPHLSGEAQANAYALYRQGKHTIQPYARYDYYGSPGEAIADRYIFDIDDGWTQLSVLNTGVRNSVYAPRCDGISHVFDLDVHADTYLGHSVTTKRTPWLYVDGTWNVTPCFRLKNYSMWSMERQRLSTINWRVEYTKNEDFAIAGEVRYRDEYAWRRVDPRNLFLESARTQDELLASSLSDKRATVLGHLFWRFDPLWAVEAQVRYGYNRSDEPDYLEYQFDLYSTLRCAWRVRSSYQHKEHDDRFTIYIGLINEPPDECSRCIPHWGT
ncbi:MAG: LPS-assembly protein LptD [Chlamydiia bacterium]|nr:LPS-assembly protein LptD [Chlamydiia bacterium]